MIKADICIYERHRAGIDGEGIRTLILFNGCPLRCKYCINNYTWDGTVESRQYLPEELLDIVSVDSVYFRMTNGGITFGGGEPLLQSQFISDFIDIAPKEWNFVVESSLYVPFHNIELIFEKVDSFIVDIKSLDSDVYKRYTGGDLAIARANLIKLMELIGQERIIVRVPIIPSFADKEIQANTIEELLKIGIKNIDSFQYAVR